VISVTKFCIDYNTRTGYGAPMSHDEKSTERLTLRIKPTLKKQVTEIAKQQKISISDATIKLLELAIPVLREVK
jgi:predicted HicB family RNase H-like nuclease